MQYLKLLTSWISTPPPRLLPPQFFVSFSSKDNQKDWRNRLSIALLFTSSVFQQSPLFLLFLVSLLLSWHSGQNVLNTWAYLWWGLNGKHWHILRVCYATLAPVQSHLKSVVSSVHAYFSLFLITRLKFATFLYKQYTLFLKGVWFLFFGFLLR